MQVSERGVMFLSASPDSCSIHSFFH